MRCQSASRTHRAGHEARGSRQRWPPTQARAVANSIRRWRCDLPLNVFPCKNNVRWSSTHARTSYNMSLRVFSLVSLSRALPGSWWRETAAGRLELGTETVHDTTGDVSTIPKERRGKVREPHRHHCTGTLLIRGHETNVFIQLRSWRHGGLRRVRRIHLEVGPSTCEERAGDATPKTSIRPRWCEQGGGPTIKLLGRRLEGIIEELMD
mmetsp:Transcript_25166/g.65953  ORF Transcript_25166/g.65953 Transcript_25166/m.65953 type:complete len:209 (-) Transcript_25166:853-1479(-)